MIPNYQQFMRPVLEAAKGGEVKYSEVKQTIVDTLGLTEEEKERRIPSGRQTFVANRIGWAKTYLTKAGLLELTRKGYFALTERGKEALQDTAEINNAYLKRYNEFVEFLEKKNDKSDLDNDEMVVNSTQVTSDDSSENTPDETLREAYNTINRAMASDILELTRKVTPAFFERLLIDLLVAMGYGGSSEDAARELGKSGDDGVDGVIDQDALGVDQIYIQAKRYAESNKVGAGDIRDFFGALNLKNASKGIFITTSDFTAQARETAQKLSMRIVLINGNELAKLMLRYNIGCRDEQVLYLKKIDEEFFEN